MAEPTYPHVIDKPYVWWTERDRIGIAYLDSGSAIYPANYDSSGFKYSSMTGRVYSPAEFPEEFHEALVDKVIQHGYERAGDVNMLNVAKYWEGKYMLKVREGIAYTAKNKVGGFKKILGHF